MSCAQLLFSPLPSLNSGSTASSGLTTPITMAPTPFAASLPTSGETFGSLNVPLT